MRYLPWRISVFMAAAFLPVYWLYQAWSFDLGPDPGKVLVERFGLGTLVLLLITLSLTPLQRVSGWSGWILVRRQLGLWCFAYAMLHLAAYTFFILGFDWASLGAELGNRPYILVGFMGWLGLLVMALTSNRYSQRLMGRNWKRLHRLAYVVLGLGLLHMLWIVRSDMEEWAIYAALGVALLILRLPPVAAGINVRRRSQ